MNGETRSSSPTSDPATGSSPTSRPQTRETSPPPTSSDGPAFLPSPTEVPRSPATPSPFAPPTAAVGSEDPRDGCSVLLAGMGIVGGIGYLGILPAWSGPTPPKALAGGRQEGHAQHRVTERGNLESAGTVDGICELSGNQNKIIHLVPEGNEGQEGGRRLRFDAAEIEKNIAQQEIKVKQAVARIETTQQEMEIQEQGGERDHRRRRSS